MSVLECRIAGNGHADISVYDIDKPVKENGTDERYVLFGDSDALSDKQRRSIANAVHALKDYESSQKKSAAVAALAQAGVNPQSARQLVDDICKTVEERRTAK
jgi:hypothetical protein